MSFKRDIPFTTKAMKNICNGCPDAVKTCICQLWFKRFKYGACDKSKPYSGRWPTLNNDTLNETIASDTHQTKPQI